MSSDHQLLSVTPLVKRGFLSVFLPSDVPSSATGRFTLVTDTHGLPLSLAAHEQQCVAWPMGLGVSSSSRKYVSDLRPVGTPGREEGLVGLLTEKSAAGEEVRMILFCTVLVCLAGYGFATVSAEGFGMLVVVLTDYSERTLMR